MDNVIPFDVEFDGTDMTVSEIQEKARSKGWPGLHIDMSKWHDGGPLPIKRMTEAAAYGT